MGVYIGVFVDYKANGKGSVLEPQDFSEIYLYLWVY